MSYILDLKSFRKANGFNQEAAANYFGCNQSFISLIETGRAKPPTEFISKLLSDTNIDKTGLKQTDVSNETKFDSLVGIINRQIDIINDKDKQINNLINIIDKLNENK